MGGQEDFTKSLKAIMARKRDELGEPPTPEELLAYRDDRLDPAERRRLEARIAVYPDAARTLADLAAFPAVEPARGVPELSDEEIGARWQKFRERLPEYPEPKSQEEEPARPAAIPIRRGSSQPWPFGLRLAAALVCVAAGWAAGFLNGRSSPGVPGSAINVKIAELAPMGKAGDRSEAKILEMPEGSEELVLVLGTPVAEDFSSYEAEIVDSEGARIWARQGLRPTEMGTFQVSFREGALRPGTLRIQLFGRNGKSRTSLTAYSIRLVPAAEPP